MVESIKTRSEYYLLIEFSAKMRIATRSSLPEWPEQLTLGKDKYNEVFRGDFYGFYDWLRDTNMQIVGLRYHPFEDAHFLFDAVRGLNYCSVEEDNSSFNTYFCNESLFVISDIDSDDQTFGGNKIYKSVSGTYVVSFDATQVISHLTHLSVLKE